MGEPHEVTAPFLAFLPCSHTSCIRLHYSAQHSNATGRRKTTVKSMSRRSVMSFLQWSRDSRRLLQNSLIQQCNIVRAACDLIPRNPAANRLARERASSAAKSARAREFQIKSMAVLKSRPASLKRRRTPAPPPPPPNVAVVPPAHSPRSPSRGSV